MSKNIYCLVGPSGCGKTTVAELLETNYGLKSVQSYTTRKPRYEGETGHLFVTPEEFHALGEMCAYTLFDGNEYGVTSDIIDACDIYVIDVAGVDYLRKHYSGSKGIVVFGLFAPEEVLADRMKKRGDTDEKISERLAHDEKAFACLLKVSDHPLDTQFVDAIEISDHIAEWIFLHEADMKAVRREKVY